MDNYATRKLRKQAELASIQPSSSLNTPQSGGFMDKVKKNLLPPADFEGASNLPMEFTGVPFIQRMVNDTEIGRKLDANEPIKKFLNSPTGIKITQTIADKTANLPLKGLAAYKANKAVRDNIFKAKGFNGLKEIGDKTYEDAYNALLEERNDPSNPYWQKILYDVQDSGAQSAIGALLAVSTSLLTRSPKVGQAVAGGYFSALSAEEQRQSKGKVTSLTNIGIDTIGDTIIAGFAESAFKSILKEGGESLLKSFGKKTAQGFLVEGGTEPTQTLLKFANDYGTARTPEEKRAVLAQTVDYVKSGGIIDEFLVGGLSGAGITAGAAGAGAIANKGKMNTINQESVEGMKKQYEGTDIMTPEGTLNPKLVEGRVSDVVAKLKMKVGEEVAGKYQEEMQGKTFASYDEFQKINDEVTKKLGLDSIPVNPNIVVEDKTPEEKKAELVNAYEQAPDTVKEKIPLISKKITPEEAATMFRSDEEIGAFAMVLQKAMDVETNPERKAVIESNLNAIKETGVDLPGIPVKDEPKYQEMSAEESAIRGGLEGAANIGLGKGDYSDMVARERFDLPNLKKVSFGGSDRDVYSIGDDKVLKIVKTSRGLTQNAYSADYYAEDAGLIPKTIEQGKNYIVKEKVDAPDANTKEMVRELKKLSNLNTGGFYNREAYQREHQQAIEIMNKYGYPGDDLMNYGDVLWGDMQAIRNWGTTKEGKPILLDEGTLNGTLVSGDTVRGKNMTDPEFREIYNKSREAKKKYKDKDSKTMYQEMKDGEKDEARMFEGQNVIYKGGITTFEEAKKQFRKFIKENELPLSMADEITTDTGRKAFGVTTKDMVAFVRNPKENTAPHEAVHAYIKLFIGQKKYNKLINYIKENKLTKQTSTKDAEEWLADNFEYYIKENEMKKPDTKIQRLFDWIKKQIIKLSGKEDKVDAFYKALYEGKRPGRLKQALNKKAETGIKFQSDTYKGELPEKKKKTITKPIEINTNITPEGTLRAKEVFKTAWRRLYGEEAPNLLTDLIQESEDGGRETIPKELIEKAFRVSFHEGKRFQAIKDQEKIIAMKQKNLAKIRQIKADLRKMFKDKNAKIQDIKSQAVKYIKANLPEAKRGKFLTAVRDAKTNNNLNGVMASVDETRKQFERAILKKSINRIVKNMHRLPVEIQKDIIRIVDQIELKKHTKRLMERIQANKVLYDSLSEEMRNNTSRRVLEELKILERTPIDQISTNKLAEINLKLQQLSIIGRYELRYREEIRKKTKEQKLKDLKEGSQNLDFLNDTERRNKLYRRNLSKRGVALLKFKEVRESLRDTDLKLMGTDRVIRLLDKGNDDWSGKNATIIMNPVMDNVNVATNRIDNFVEVYKEALADLKKETFKELLAKKGIENVEDLFSSKAKMALHAKTLYKIFREQQRISENIAIYAHSKNEASLKKLIEDGKYTMEQIQAIQKEVEESEYQFKLYKFMRNQLDKIHPELSKAYTKVHPTEELGFIKDFFPNRTDYAITNDTDMEDVDRLASVNFASLKSRKRGAHQILTLDSITDFQNYMESAMYYISMAESINESRNLIESEEYREAVGEVGQRYMKKWLKIVSKRGGHLIKRRPFEKFLDFLRTNLGPSFLGLRPSSVVRQLTAGANGAAAIGEKDYARGSAMMVSEKWRNFMKDNSSQMRHRFGGDVLWNDLSEKEILKKIQDYTTKGIRIADYIPAGATWVGAYTKKLNELGLEITTKEYNQEAGRYADLMVRLSQGTAHYASAPQALFDENRSYWRAFFIFETFNLSNWAQVSKDVPASWRADKKKGAKKLAWLMIQYGMSAGVTTANAALLRSLFNDDDDDRTYISNLVQEVVGTIPFANKLFSYWNYSGSPVLMANFLGDLLFDLKYSFQGKKEATRTKHQIQATAAMLQLFTGLPPDFIVKTLTKMIGGSGSGSNY